MKKLAMISLLMMIVFSSLFGYDGNKRIDFGKISYFDDISVQSKSDRIILFHNETHHKIILTHDAILIVDGKDVPLTEEEQQLCNDFYTEFHVFLAEVQEVAQKGARLGVKGTKLGLSALVKTIKLIRPDYDSDDLEKEIEKKAAKIEEEANKLERQAEKLERQSGRLSEQWKKMQMAIPELNSFDWF